MRGNRRDIYRARKDDECENGMAARIGHSPGLYDVARCSLVAWTSFSRSIAIRCRALLIRYLSTNFTDQSMTPDHQTTTVLTMLKGKALRLQYLTLLLCLLVVAIDGFDTGIAAYISPLIRRDWSLAASQLGPLFGAGLLGLALGNFIWGPVADKLGCKRVIMISMLIFGGASIASASAPSLSWLIALRFLTGLGLGGALPNAVTLATEYSPTRGRALLVTIVLLGFPGGLAFGGIVSPLIAPRFSWPGVFIFGGAIPLLLLPTVWLFLPESLHFMIGKPRFEREVRAILRKLGNIEPYEASVHHSTKPELTLVVAVRNLFDGQYRRGTSLLWTTFFCSMWAFYQVTNWLPTVFTDAGVSLVHSSTIASLFPLGGILGSLVTARMMDKYNPYMGLLVCYAIGALCVTLIGFSVKDVVLVQFAVFAAGIGLGGVQPCLIYFSANFYPDNVRATGVAWALGVGRTGSIIGAATGGTVLGNLHSLRGAFLLFSAPVVIAGIAIFAMMIAYRSRYTRPTTKPNMNRL